MLKLKLQYFGHLMWRADSFEKTLMLWKIEGRRRRGQQRMRWLDGITDSMDMGLGELRSKWWTGRPGVLWFMGSQRVGHDWVAELNWMEKWTSILLGFVYPAFMWLFVVTAGPPGGELLPLPSLSPLLSLDTRFSPMWLPGLQPSLRPAPWWTMVAFFWLYKVFMDQIFLL